MVSGAPTTSRCVNKGLVGVNAALRKLHDLGHTYAVVEPGWRQQHSVFYKNGRLERSTLNPSDFDLPQSIKTDRYPKWCGDKPRKLTVYGYTVNNTYGSALFVAAFVRGHGKSHMNPLLAKMLLQARGFHTGAGCYKCVNVDAELTTLKTMSNALSLVKPDFWVVSPI